MIRDTSAIILAIEDNHTNLKLIGHILEPLDVETILVGSGQEAFDYLETQLPDLILLDIMMAKMNGYEVCEKLKNNPQTRDIPVIFITALKEEEDETKGFDLGAVDFISKPIKPVILQARVKTHLRLKLKTDLLESLASIDGLTDIPNRRYFEETLESEWNRAIRDVNSPLSLIIIDIDDFKKFNDQYGHAVGDDCLRKVAKSLKACIQRPGDSVSRFGGEEFAVILPNTDNQFAVSIADTMCKKVESLNISHLKSNVSDYVTISVGVGTINPEKDSDLRSIVNIADQNLYKAKANGKNQVYGNDNEIEKIK